MLDTLKILTPEKVYVEHELANLGSRFTAFMIDFLIQIVIGGSLGLLMYWASFGITMDGIEGIKQIVDSYFVAVLGIMIFVVFFGYFIIFEILMNGQTPGKKVMKLRAIEKNGMPIQFWASVIRNILRIADSLPILYLMGSFFMVISSNHQRVGDIFANTVVSKERHKSKKIKLSQIETTNYDIGASHVINDNLDGYKYKVSPEEYSILKRYMERKGEKHTNLVRFEVRLANYFLGKFNVGRGDNSPEEFLNEIIKNN